MLIFHFDISGNNFSEEQLKKQSFINNTFNDKYMCIGKIYFKFQNLEECKNMILKGINMDSLFAGCSSLKY